MSRVHPRVVAQWALAAAAVAATVVTVASLHASTPYLDEQFIVEAADDPTAPGEEIVTCKRRLPDVAQVDLEALEDVEPVGRATSSEIVECPELFDGQVVFYIGEVVGDVLRRDGGAWALVNDDAYAVEVGPLAITGEYRGYNSGLSVWLDESIVPMIDRPGGPDWRGTVLRLRGVVRRTDTQDGGGLTLRAFEGQVLAEARPIARPFHWRQAVAAVVIAALALATIVWERTVARNR